MSTANGGSPIIGRSTPRSSAMPNTAIKINVPTKAKAKGAPGRSPSSGTYGNSHSNASIRLNATNAPNIIMSPWAKLTISVAL